MTILITGGTGKTGSRVAHLLTHLGHPDPGGDPHSDPAFDWYDEGTWERAIDGCPSAYVTFQPDLGLPGADEIIGRFARAAVAAGCHRLVCCPDVVRKRRASRTRPRRLRGRLDCSLARPSSCRTSPRPSAPRRSRLGR